MIPKTPIEIHQYSDSSERFIHFYNVNRESELTLIQAGYQVPCHSLICPKIRDHYLIHFIQSGSGCFYLQNSTYLSEQNNCFLIYPNEISSYQSVPDSTWSYYWIGITGTRAEEFMSLLGFAQDKHGIQFQNPVVFELLEQIVDSAFQHKDNATNLYLCLNSLILQLFFLLHQEKQKNLLSFSTFISEDNTSLFGISQSADNYVNSIIMLIQNNYEQDLRVDSIANHLHLNRSYLSSLFKKETGVSIKHYLQHYRIEVAKRLLCETTRTITEISFQCGFQDPLYFSHFFKLQTGVSPSDYRIQ